MQKIKQFVESDRGKDILTVLIVILVGLGSFGLGRLSKGNPNAGIKIEYSNQEASVVSTVNKAQNSATQAITNTGKNFFASNRGSKYYPLGCEAGKSLKQENRIYFNTREEAERAGYELSGSCR